MALLSTQREALNKGLSTTPRSRAFFLELVLNLLIFALCAVVALQVFVASRLSIDESAALSQLNLNAQALAEQYKAGEGSREDFSLNGVIAEWQQAEDTGLGVYTLFYDKDLAPLSEDSRTEPQYRLELAEAARSEDGTEAITVNAYQGEEQLFSFTVTRYEPQERR